MLGWYHGKQLENVTEVKILLCACPNKCIFEPLWRWDPRLGCSSGMRMMGKCLTVILSLAVTVASK